MFFGHVANTKSYVSILLLGLFLTGTLIYTILTYPPLVTLGLLIGVPSVLLIFARPIFGLLLITLISPLNDLQRFSVELNMVRVVGLITILSFLFNLFTKGTSVKSTPLNLPVLILALSYVLPYFNAELGRMNVSFLVSLFSIFAFYFAAVNIISSERDIKLLFSGLLLSGTILGVLSLYSYISGSQLFLFQDTSSTGILISKIRGETISQATGSSTNPNEFAVLFILLLPFSLNNIFQQERLCYKAVYTVLTGIFILTLLATLSRSALLGAALSSGFLVVKNITAKRKVTLRLAMTVCLSSLCFSLLYFTFFTAVHENVVKRALLTADYREDKTITDRLLLYPAAVKMTWDNPFGVGYGNFDKEIAEYYGIMRGAHNTILNVMGSNGFLGLIAILWFLYVLFRSLFKTAFSQANGERRFLALCFIGSFIAFWIHASFHSLLHWNMLWLFFAMAMASVRRTRGVASRYPVSERSGDDEAR